MFQTYFKLLFRLRNYSIKDRTGRNEIMKISILVLILKFCVKILETKKKERQNYRVSVDQRPITYSNYTEEINTLNQTDVAINLKYCNQ